MTSALALRGAGLRSPLAPPAQRAQLARPRCPAYQQRGIIVYQRHSAPLGPRARQSPLWLILARPMVTCAGRRRSSNVAVSAAYEHGPRLETFIPPKCDAAHFRQPPLSVRIVAGEERRSLHCLTLLAVVRSSMRAQIWDHVILPASLPGLVRRLAVPRNMDQPYEVDMARLHPAILVISAS